MFGFHASNLLVVEIRTRTSEVSKLLNFPLCSKDAMAAKANAHEMCSVCCVLFANDMDVLA